jgi:hypothetical protein
MGLLSLLGAAWYYHPVVTLAATLAVAVIVYAARCSLRSS